MPKAKNLYRSLVCGVVLVGALPSALPAQAPAEQSTAPDIATEAAGLPPPIVQPLARLTHLPGPMRLEGVDAEQRLTLPISSRLEVRKATLHLEVTSSTAMLEKVSSLTVVLNGRSIAQLPYSPAQPSFAVDLLLPRDLLRTGYNDLRLRAVQHYTDRCERPESPELWSEVDLLRSHVRLEASLGRVAVAAGRIDALFDAKLWSPLPLTIVTAGPPADDATLQVGAIAAQAVALHYRFHPIEVLHAEPRAAAAPQTGTFPGLDTAGFAAGDAILIGTRDELAPYVADSLAAQIGDSYLAVLPNDADPSRAIVLVSGSDDAGVLRAAQAFALARGIPYPGSAALSPSLVDTPELAPYSRVNGVYPDTEFTFRELGLGDSTTRDEPVHLEVNLPPDLFGRDDADVELRLNFAYSAGLRDDSSVEVLLNGLLSRPIRLTSPDGGSFSDYVVSIPLKSFRPGSNVISFVPVFRGLHEGECQQPIDARLTLHGDSRLVMPKAGHYTRLPDLARFAESLFPLTVMNDGGELAVRVLGDGSDPVSAAWTLLAKFAQVNGYPLLAAQVTRGAPEPGRHEVLVGALSALPAAVLSGAPLQMTDPSIARYATGLRPSDAERKAPPGMRGWTTTRVELNPVADARAAITMPRALGDLGLLMQYRRNGAASTVLVTASSPGLLRQRVNALVSFDVWSSLAGDTVFWHDSAASVVAKELGDGWHVGDMAVAKKVEFWFSRYPWWWLLLLFAALTFVALLVRGAIVRRKATRHPDVQQEHEF
ncbi:MAG: cellulose biosynthesis cyclic di-GMP-binding regulatory protein BcsB [Steroidobacteraceae bacterium]|nr:cellulose biosynthesis cyclic di-GMP-binding regulatory protein BcsB [Steroidobacteraceae bacterium]